MKGLILNIINTFKSLFNKISIMIKKTIVYVALKVKGISVEIFIFLKTVIIAIKNYLKIISKFMWQHMFIYIKIILKFLGKLLYLVIFKILKYIYKYFIRFILMTLKSIMLLIYRGIVIIIRFIFLKIVYPIAKLFLMVSKHIYILIKRVSTAIWRFCKPIFEFIYHIIKFVVTGLIDIVSYIFKTIWKGIKYVLQLLQSFYTVIKIIIFKLCNWVLTAIKSVFRGIKHILIVFITGVKNLPEQTYLILYTMFIYLYLAFRFILIDLFTFVFWTTPKYILNLLISFFNLIITCIEVVFINLFKFILRWFKLLFKKLFLVLQNIINWIVNYYYIILLFPFVLPLLVMIFIALIIKNFFIFIYILLWTITNQQLNHKSEAIIVKVGYLPSMLLIKNAEAILRKYQYNYLFSTKIQNLIQNVDILVWQSIYMIIFVPIGVIILAPVTILLLVFYLLSGKDIVRLVGNIESNGLVILPDNKGILKNYYFKIKTEYLFDSENKLVVIKNCDCKKLAITIYKHNEFVNQFMLPIAYDDEYLLVSRSIKIQNQITIENDMILMPPIRDNDLLVSYEKVYAKDNLVDNILTIRPGANFSKIIVKVGLLNFSKCYEKQIRFNNLVNPQLVSGELFTSKIYRLHKHESFVTVLDKRLKYTFIPSDDITEEGVIKNKIDKPIKLKFYIEGLPTKVYTANVSLIFDNRDIKELLSLIPKPEIDFHNKTIYLQESIKLVNHEDKPITWYINNKLYNKIDNDSYFKQHKLILIASVNIDGKIYERKFEFKNSMLFTYENENLQAYLDQVDANKKIVKLPIFINSYIKVVKWKSLNPSYIKSSGKILNQDFTSVFFEVTLYRNIFKKKKSVVNLRIKPQDFL